MKNTIAFVFRSAPFASSAGREGVDAVLATTAYTDEVGVFFMADGVYHLRSGQQPALLDAKDHLSMLKLFNLYDINQIFVSAESLESRHLDIHQLIDIGCSIVPLAQAVFSETLRHYAIVLTF